MLSDRKSETEDIFPKVEQRQKLKTEHRKTETDFSFLDSHMKRLERTWKEKTFHQG
jgi:hypothetical protein